MSNREGVGLRPAGLVQRKTEVQPQPGFEFLEFDRLTCGDEKRAHVLGETRAGKHDQAGNGPGLDVLDGGGR